LLLSIEEVRRSFGCISNGLGRLGTKETGYTVYGEYTTSFRSSLYENRKNSKDTNQPVESTTDLKKSSEYSPERNIQNLLLEIELAIDRVVINFEKKRNSKIDRRRINLKHRREKYDIEKEKQELLGVRSSTIKGAEELSEAITLSGILPTVHIITKLLARELRAELNHRKILRNRERARTQHALTSHTGIKGLGMRVSTGSSSKTLIENGYEGGYYGYNFTLKGPLDGARRTITHVIKIGKVPRGTKRARRVSSHEHAKTTVGTIGIFGTYCYGRG